MKKEQREGEMYKKVMRESLKEGNFCPFRYEHQMERLFAFLKKDLSGKRQLTIMEAGCGQGRFLYYAQQFDPRQRYVGIDYLSEHVAFAKKFFCDYPNISIEKEDFHRISRKYPKTFDISVSYKTLSWLSDYQKAVKELFSVTKKKIYITSLFTEGKFSFETKVLDTSTGNFSHLNTYSMEDFEQFCLKNGAKKVEFHKIEIPFDLPKPKMNDVLRTYTQKISASKSMEITGLVILHWKLVIIHL